MDEKLLTIGQAAEMLGVSIDTLRRWDKSGHFMAIRKTPGGDRYYKKTDIDFFIKNFLLYSAKAWASNEIGIAPESIYYCATSDVFKARLKKLEDELGKIFKLRHIYPLISAIAGEIGNNSFDHNLGNWPDIAGIFFAYNLNKKQIILADRGQGILTTLKRVKPQIKNNAEALNIAFTEIISGRAPEARGNGLKFVKEVVINNDLSLFFQTGDAEFNLKKGGNKLNIKTSGSAIYGCLALIKF